MTIEEKAMAYDEALKDMRVIYPNLSGDTKLAIENAFPQLKESEDERIRKHIIDIIKDNAKSKCIPCDAEIAYLEKQKDLDKMIVVSPEVWDKAISDAFENGKKEGKKQKEQKPDSLIYDKDLDKAAREFYLSGGADSPTDSTGLVPIVRIAEFGATWMKERMEKEQKPAEKQDYSGLNDLEKAIHRGFLAAGVDNVPVEIIKETAKECLTQVKPAEWAELQSEFKNINEAFESGKKEVLAHPERYGLCEQKPVDYDAELKKCKDNPLYFFDKYVTIKQKPMEWSEEDKLHYANILEALEYVKGCKSDYDKIEAIKSDIVWFQSFRLQSKQEWSEEDKEKLKAICTYLRDYSRLAKLGDKLRFNEYCDFLESLRPQGSKDSLQPHWKPSEEQMKAFKKYIEEFQARAEAAVGGWNNFDVMIQLYEQLKKL